VPLAQSFIFFSTLSALSALFDRPHPPSALLGKAAERNFDHPSHPPLS
jgi:hypothetical protein